MFKKWSKENHLLLESNTWISVPRRVQVLFATECANKTLYIYEQEFPNDNRPRKAVEAAFGYGLTGKPINQNIIDDAWNAAAAAYAAYYASRAADADAYAVDAAAAAAAYAVDAANADAVDAVANANAAIVNAVDATGLDFDSLKEKVIGKTNFNESWKTTHTLGIAKKIWETRQLGNLPILADALIDAGCYMDLVNYMINNEEQTLADFFLWNLNL